MKPLTLTFLFSAVWFLPGCDNSQAVKVAELEAKAVDLQQENRTLREEQSQLRTVNATLTQEKRQLQQQIQEQRQNAASLGSEVASQTAAVQKLTAEKAVLERRLAATPTSPAPAPPPVAAAPPAQVPAEILAAIQEAVQCKDYKTAVGRLKQCEDRVSGIADAATQALAQRQVMLGRESCLNNEIMEQMTAARQARGQMPFSVSGRFRPKSYTGQMFTDEVAYERDRAHYQLCLRHNAEVRTFNETATALKRLLEELQTLQADRSVPWKVNVAAVSAELVRLQEGVGMIAISGAPKLGKVEGRGSTISVGAGVRR